MCREPGLVVTCIYQKKEALLIAMDRDVATPIIMFNTSRQLSRQDKHFSSPLNLFKGETRQTWGLYFIKKLKRVVGLLFPE